MRFKIILLFIGLSSYSNAQDYSKSELIKIQVELNREINTLNDSLENIQGRLLKLKKDSITNSLKDEEFIVEIVKEAKIRDEPNTYDVVLKIIPKGEKVKITGITEKKGFYKACYEDKCGYISDTYFNIIPEFQNWAGAMEIKYKKEKQEKEDAQYQARLKEYKKEQESLIKKYGKATYEDIKAGKIWIGMTDEQCKLSLGEPSKINRSVGSWGTHEQWVYSKSDLYIYFENGKLTSWQD